MPSVRDNEFALPSKLHPNIQNPKHVDGVLEASHLPITTDPVLPNYARHSSSSNPSAYAISPPPPDSPVVDSDELEPSDNEEEAVRNIVENMPRIPVLTQYMQGRKYQGKSSSLLFLQTVIDTGIERSRSAEPFMPRETGMAPPNRAETRPVSVCPIPTIAPDDGATRLLLDSCNYASNDAISRLSSSGSYGETG